MTGIETAPKAQKIGDPETIRTSGLQIRNLPLYPAELRGQSRVQCRRRSSGATIFPAGNAVTKIRLFMLCSLS